MFWGCGLRLFLWCNLRWGFYPYRISLAEFAGVCRF